MSYDVASVKANNPVGTVLGEDNSMNGMTSEDFYALLVTELSQQDPFEPVGNQEILNQINSIRSMESDEAMVDTMELMADTTDTLSLTLQSMMLQNDMITGSDLMGKEVTAQVTQQVEGEDEGVTELVEMTGIVEGVRLVKGEVHLDIRIDGEEDVKTVPISDVAYVGMAPVVETEENETEEVVEEVAETTSTETTTTT